MTDIAPKINYILPRGKQIHVIVTDLIPAGKLFPSAKSKAADGQIRCHMFKGQYEDFPHPVSLQWCNSNLTVTEFKNGDRILIQPGNYNNEALIQSVSWVKTEPRENQRAKMEAIINNEPLTAPLPAPQGQRRVSDNPNPQVMGSLWSICIGHAINFNKDRKGADIKSVLLDAAVLENDFKQRMGND